MAADAFTELVRQMRNAQKAFYLASDAQKRRENLAAAKRLEEKVDRVLEFAKDKPSNPGAASHE